MKQFPGNSQTKRAVFDLRRCILEGRFQGGTRLYEVALAEELKISRTPVREAMSRLVEEGLLERASGGGFRVRSFTLNDVFDAIELRGILEGTAARLAAERGVSPEELTDIKIILTLLDDCFTKLGGTVDFDKYAELNANFHDKLSKLCRSDILYRELERAKSLPFASPSAFMPDKLEISVFCQSLFHAQEQHRALLTAIEAREGARAEAIAREHARIARNNLEFVVSERSELVAQLPSLAIVVE